MGVEVALAYVATAASVGAAANSVVQGERASRQARRTGRQRAAAMRAEAAAERERGRRLAASQRAAYGAAGVQGAGTPLYSVAGSLLENLRARERILAGARNVQSDANAQADALRLQGIQGAVSNLGAASQSAFSAATATV